MDPVEHDSRSIAPVPVGTGRQVVVLTLVELIEIQVRVSRLEFPRTWTNGAGNHKEIRRGDIASELSSVLTEPLEDSIFAGQKIAQMGVAAVSCLSSAADHIDAGQKRFALQSHRSHDGSKFQIACCVAVGI